MTGTLSQAWNATVRRDPSAVALVNAGTGETWTRAQLSGAVDIWCAGIPEASALARRRVAMSEPNGLGWWAAFLGLMQLGAVPVMIDAGEPKPRQLELARSARAVRLWSDGQWLDVAPARAAAPDHCLVKLTSGSSGVPRAWAFTHAQMLADGSHVCESMGIGPQDINLATIPLGHSYGLGNLVVPLIAKGTAMVLVDPPLPNVLASAASRWKCTVFPAVPALLDALCRSSANPAALSGLRLVITAGARMEPRVATAFHARFGLKVHNFYGASETGGICYDRSGDATLSGRSVGTPLEGVRLRWRGRQRFVVESAAVRGSGTFVPVDLGTLAENGELVLLGRAGRLVKIGARRVDLGEIEAALRSLPGVRDAHVIADVAGRPGLAAAVATDLTKEQVRAHLHARLAPWKQPHRIVVLSAMPVNARGKTDRATLERMLSGAAGGTPPDITPA